MRALKVPFYLEKLYFIKNWKLAEGDINNVRKHFYIFNKISEKFQWRKSLALILIFEAARQKSAVFFFTCVYKKFHKDFQRTSRWLLPNYDFFLQESELNKKLVELSLKVWIRPWFETEFLYSRSNFQDVICTSRLMNFLHDEFRKR